LFHNGRSSGIGCSLAIGLAKEGMNLFITDIDMENFRRVKNEIEQLELGIKVFTGKCEVSKLEVFEKVAEKFYSELGGVDLLFNNS